MLGNAWAWVKDHALLSIGLVIGVVVFWRVFTGSGSASAAAGTLVDPTAVQSGLQITAMQYAAQAEAQRTQAQLDALTESNATEIALADMQAQLARFQIGTTANIEQSKIDLERYGIATSAELQSEANAMEAAAAANELAARMSIANMEAAAAANSLAAQMQIAEMQNTTNTALIQAQKDAAKLQADTMLAVQQSNARTQSQLIASQTKIATQSWWDKLF